MIIIAIIIIIIFMIAIIILIIIIHKIFQLSSFEAGSKIPGKIKTTKYNNTKIKINNKNKRKQQLHH